MKRLIKKIGDCCLKIKQREVQELLDAILKAEKIFLYGAGRSGLVGKAFAMRICQLGMRAYFAGEASVPPIGKGDVFVAVSRSGRTKTTIALAKIAKGEKAVVFSITSSAGSPLAGVSDAVLEVPESAGEILGAVFEHSVFLLLDSLVPAIAKREGVGEGELAKRHANLQ